MHIHTYRHLYIYMGCCSQKLETSLNAHVCIDTRIEISTYIRIFQHAISDVMWQTPNPYEVRFGWFRLSPWSYRQGGEDAQGASCRSLSAKEPLIIGLLCENQPTTLKHPMHHRQPALSPLTPWPDGPLWHLLPHWSFLHLESALWYLGSGQRLEDLFASPPCAHIR